MAAHHKYDMRNLLRQKMKTYKKPPIYNRMTPDGTPCDPNAILRGDLLITLTSLKLSLRKLGNIIEILANDDGEICGNNYMNARKLGLTL